MSAFTDRLYAEFLARNGGSGRPARAAPRAKATVNNYDAWRRMTGRDAGATGGPERSAGRGAEPTCQRSEADPVPCPKSLHDGFTNAATCRNSALPEAAPDRQFYFGY